MRRRDVMKKSKMTLDDNLMFHVEIPADEHLENIGKNWPEKITVIINGAEYITDIYLLIG